VNFEFSANFSYLGYIRKEYNKIHRHSSKHD